jgi:diguanylate cyclase (GGDEF)-like protein/PAS domain S-box-containing protein
VGRIGSLFTIPFIGYLIFQDLYFLGDGNFLAARLIALGICTATGLVVWFYPRDTRMVLVLSALSIAGLIAMNFHVVFMVFGNPGDGDVYRAMASNTLTLFIYASLLMAGGLRRWLPLLVGAPLAVLLLSMAGTARLDIATWAWLSGPLMAGLLVAVIALEMDRDWRLQVWQATISVMRQKQLEAILDAITESAFMVDTEFRMVYGNSTMAQRFGRPLDELRGRSVMELLPPGVLDHRKRMLEEVFRIGQARRFEDQRAGMWFDQTIYPVKDEAGIVRFAVIFGKDISAQKAREEQLVFEVFHDPLTGLANHRSLDARLDQAIGRARRGYRSTLLFIDLDGFKAINDRHGHAMGDRMLKAVSALLLEGARDHDAVFRVGGDEFAILAEGAGLEDALHVAERIRMAVADFELVPGPGVSLRVSLSVGCALIDGSRPRAEVAEAADGAMYRAKQAGRNRVELARLP